MKNYLKLTNRVLLGLLMLVAGLLKLFASGPDAVTGMLSSMALFSWAPAFWAWTLIAGEVLSGAAILANYKLKYAVIPPMVILTVAAFFVYWGNWYSLIMHLVAVSGYSLLAYNK